MRGPGTLLCGLAFLVAGCAKVPPKVEPETVPEVRSVEPAVLWTVAGGTVVVAGRNFFTPLPVADEQVTVRLAPLRGLDGAPLDGSPIEVPATVKVTVAEDQTTDSQVTLEVAPGALAAGVYGLEADARSGGSLRIEELVAVLATPMLGPPERVYACTGARSDVPALAAAGTDLPTVNGAGPTGSLYGTNEPLSPALSDCQVVPFARADLQLCQRLEAPSPPGLGPYSFDATIRWPAPLDAAPVGTGRLILLDPPEVLPGEALRAPGVPIRVPGAFFVDPDRPPVATLGGQPVAITPEECAPSMLGLSRCYGFSTVIPLTFGAGSSPLTLTTSPGCTATTLLDVGPLPVVTGLSTSLLCGGDLLFVEGRGFVRAMATFGSVQDRTGLCLDRSDGPCDTLMVTTEALPAGHYEVAVRNGTAPPTTSSALPLAVVRRIEAGRAVPFLISGLVSRPVFVPIAWAGGPITEATLYPQPAGSPVPPGMAVQVVPVGGGVEVTLPAHLAEGKYVIHASDQGPCPGISGEVWTLGTAPPLQQTYEEVFSAMETRRWPLDGSEGTAGPLVTLAAGEGNPGTALRAGEQATAVPWYFAQVLLGGIEGVDAALVRFDLRVEGAGPPLDAPQVILLAGVQGAAVRLEHALDPAPGPAWTHYALGLRDPAGWVVRDAFGTHPATAEELAGVVAGSMNALHVLGSWTVGPNEAWFDNLVVELVQ